jgi:hypothetical protein
MRPLIVFAILLTSLFAVLVGIIRARPYDETQFQALTSSDNNCSLPCFMGIRLGVTRVDEAMTIISSHEWVRNYAAHLSSYGGVLVTWNWSGRQPAFIDGTRPGGLGTGNSSVVTRIDLFTNVPLGDFVVWRPPDAGGLRCTSAARITGLFVHYAEAFSAEVIMPPVRCLGSSPCPLSIQELYFTPAVVTIGDNYLPHTDFQTILNSPVCTDAE